MATISLPLRIRGACTHRLPIKHDHDAGAFSSRRPADHKASYCRAVQVRLATHAKIAFVLPASPRSSPYSTHQITPPNRLSPFNRSLATTFLIHLSQCCELYRAPSFECPWTLARDTGTTRRYSQRTSIHSASDRRRGIMAGTGRHPWLSGILLHCASEVSSNGDVGTLDESRCQLSLERRGFLPCDLCMIAYVMLPVRRKSLPLLK